MAQFKGSIEILATYLETMNACEDRSMPPLYLMIGPS